MRLITINGLALALGVFGAAAGCTKKNAEERQVRTQGEATEDVAGESKSASETAQDVQETRREPGSEAESAEAPPEPGRVGTEEQAGAAGERAEDQQEAVGKELDDRLARIDDRMDKLDDMLDTKGDAARNATQAELADVKAKREAAKTLLKELKDASETEWAALRSSVESAFLDLETSMQKAEAAVEAQ